MKMAEAGNGPVETDSEYRRASASIEPYDQTCR